MNDRQTTGQAGPVRPPATDDPTTLPRREGDAPAPGAGDAAARDWRTPESRAPDPSAAGLAPASVTAMRAGPPAAETARVDPGPRLAGVIDLLRPDRIAGWAIDRADAGARLEIEILRDGAPAVTTRADRPRPDLARGGIGDGGYGFSVELAPPLERGFEFTVSARARAADGAAVDLRRAGSAEPSPSTEIRLLQRLHGDLAALRETIAAPPPTAPAPAPGAELMRVAERMEIALARIEAVVAAQPIALPPRPAWGVQGLAAAAMVVAALSLGVGVWSAFGDRPIPAPTMPPPD